jgi:hypothetical protein
LIRDLRGQLITVLARSRLYQDIFVGIFSEISLNDKIVWIRICYSELRIGIMILEADKLDIHQIRIQIWYTGILENRTLYT